MSANPRHLYVAFLQALLAVATLGYWRDNGHYALAMVATLAWIALAAGKVVEWRRERKRFTTDLWLRALRAEELRERGDSR